MREILLSNYTEHRETQSVIHQQLWNIHQITYCIYFYFIFHALFTSIEKQNKKKLINFNNKYIFHLKSDEMLNLSHITCIDIVSTKAVEKNSLRFPWDLQKFPVNKYIHQSTKCKHIHHLTKINLFFYYIKNSYHEAGWSMKRIS